MPTIAATVYPARTYARVVTNYAGEPARWAGLWRVDELTGAETPVRPHTSYQGWCMQVGCDGAQTWWDTEIPWGRPFHYRTGSCAPNTVMDVFGRVVAGGWGTPVFGAAWTTSGGAGADYTVGAGQGKMSLTSVNVARHTFTDLGQSDVDMLVDLVPGVVALTSPIQMGRTFRGSNATNYLLAEVQFGVAGAASLRLRQQVAGAFTDLVTTGTLWTYVAATVMRLRIQVVGTAVRVKCWPTTRPEPAAWAIDTVLVPTLFPTNTIVGCRAILAAGNTNGLPVGVGFDTLTDTGLDSSAVTVSTGNSTAVGSVLGPADEWWLKDPVRPCHDVRMRKCVDGSAGCAPGAGVMVLGMDPTRRRSALSTTIQPEQAVYPISINRPRQAPQWSLGVLCRSFPDRDRVVTLLAPGEPLLLQAPAEYGMADQYLSAGEASEVRPLPDHRNQVRMMSVPYAEIARPAGPMLGPCGERVADQCNVYATWDAMEAATVTYIQLIDGTTGGPGVG